MYEAKMRASHTPSVNGVSSTASTSSSSISALDAIAAIDAILNERRPAKKARAEAPKTAEELLREDLAQMEKVRHKRCVWDEVTGCLLCPQNHAMCRRPIPDYMAVLGRPIITCDGCTRHLIIDPSLVVTSEHIAKSRPPKNPAPRAPSDKQTHVQYVKDIVAAMLDADALEYDVNEQYAFINDGASLEKVWWQCSECNVDICTSCQAACRASLQAPYAHCSSCGLNMRTGDAKFHTCPSMESKAAAPCTTAPDVNVSPLQVAPPNAFFALQSIRNDLNNRPSVATRNLFSVRRDRVPSLLVIDEDMDGFEGWQLRSKGLQSREALRQTNLPVKALPVLTFTHQVTVYDPPPTITEDGLLTLLSGTGLPSTYRCVRRTGSCVTLVVLAMSKNDADVALRFLQRYRWGAQSQHSLKVATTVTKAS